MNKEIQDYPHIDVNPVILTKDKKIILSRRKSEVFEGNKWHLPGGRLLLGERIEEALKRLTNIKTGYEISLLTGSLSNDLVGVYDDPARDKREHVVSLAYLCRISGDKNHLSYNVSEVNAFNKEDIDNLSIAFDHRTILADAFNYIEKSTHDYLFTK